MVCGPFDCRSGISAPVLAVHRLENLARKKLYSLDSCGGIASCDTADSQAVAAYGCDGSADMGTVSVCGNVKSVVNKTLASFGTSRNHDSGKVFMVRLYSAVDDAHDDRTASHSVVRPYGFHINAHCRRLPVAEMPHHRKVGVVE